MVVIGSGGVLVEVLSDRAVRLPPLDRERAVRAVATLRVAEVLAGVRGAPPVDMDAVADAVVAVSTLALELGDRIDGLDINPLSCRAEGCVALDVLVEARS